MNHRTILMLCLSAVLAPPTASARADGALTSAPVDYSLYREGEVRRSETRFGGWLLTCDGIRRLGQKFCSMRTVARSADGTVVAAITVSTDGAGRPAAIVTLPFGVSLGGGVRISYPEAARGGGRTSIRTLRPSQCDGLGCQVVWPLDAGAINHLRDGRTIGLAFARRTAASFADLDLVPGSTTIGGTIDGAGFADALAASMR